MVDFMKYVAAAGLAGTIALASSASFAQVVGADPGPYGYGTWNYGAPPVVYPYPIYQYRGGPRSPNTDIYYPGVYYDQSIYGQPYAGDVYRWR
jgi:hypothetical protein